MKSKKFLKGKIITLLCLFVFLLFHLKSNSQECPLNFDYSFPVFSLIHVENGKLVEYNSFDTTYHYIHHKYWEYRDRKSEMNGIQKIHCQTKLIKLLDDFREKYQSYFPNQNDTIISPKIGMVELGLTILRIESFCDRGYSKIMIDNRGAIKDFTEVLKIIKKEKHQGWEGCDESTIYKIRGLLYHEIGNNKAAVKPIITISV
ncbi:MAG: hypothetical protein KGY70_04510 [Bacteroidales bacterium]|nr:hypothetical protein [Bacteroidales bacterium]